MAEVITVSSRKLSSCMILNQKLGPFKPSFFGFINQLRKCSLQSCVARPSRPMGCTLVLLANVNSCSRSLYVVVRPSVCLSSVVCLSVTFVHPTQPIEIFGNVSEPFNTLVTWRHPGKILRRSSQENPSVWGLNQKVVEKCRDFGPFRGYISETVQDRR